jgi:hypothetical protein
MYYGGTPAGRPPPRGLDRMTTISGAGETNRATTAWAAPAGVPSAKAQLLIDGHGSLWKRGYSIRRRLRCESLRSGVASPALEDDSGGVVGDTTHG